MKKFFRIICNSFILTLLITACSVPVNKTPTLTTTPPTETIHLISTQTPLSSETPAAIPVFASTKVQIQLPEGPLKLVAIGDSLTQGDGDESGLNGYPTRLAKLIEAARPGAQILNLGKSGWTSNDVLNGVNGEAPTLQLALTANPNIALVWIGSNDLWYLYEYGPDPMTTEADHQDLENYKTNIDSILRQLHESGATTFIALLDDQSKRAVVANPPNPAEPAFTATSPIDLVLMSEHVKAMNEIIKEKASLYGAITVDFYDTDIFTNPSTMYSDGNHPNTAGYEKITELWFSAITPFLN